VTSRCSFCGTPADASPLFSGRVTPPSSKEPAFICLDCAGNARDELPDDAPTGPCSFCGNEGRIAARKGDVTICESCIEVCLEVSAPFVIKP
jgi:hypothetical protein